MKLGFFVFAILAALFLEGFLAKRERRLPGLILPLTSFAVSIYGVVSTVSGAAAEDRFFVGFAAFILWNLPTIVLWAVYYGMRAKRRKNQHIGSILDLD